MRNAPMFKTSAACTAVAMIATLVVAPVEARPRRAYDAGYETVTVDSHFGNGTVTGAVRPVRTGWEVQLPGGTWVGCRRSCEETLRVQSVDIFETNGRLTGYGAFQNQCGVFGCLELVYPR
jgi:hypothetical protein